MANNKKGFLALSPLLVFIFIYPVTSIVAGDFYKCPSAWPLCYQVSML